jgi:DNA-directed DNA polymerase III PolC
VSATQAAVLPGYAELHCLSNFTFLRGASHPHELVEQAEALGYHSLAITDECSVAGAVRAHMACKERQLKLIIGAELRLTCALRLVLLARDRRGYGQLCRLITRGRRSAGKGQYALTRADIESLYPQDCCVLWLPARAPDVRELQWLHERFSGRLRIAVELLREGADALHLRELTALGARYGVPLIASGDVHMHVRARRRLQDALTAIRLNVPVAEAGARLYANGERYLRERARLARLYPHALLEATVELAQECQFSLGELRYEYPRELVPDGHTPASYLRQLTEEGARWRWPQGLPHAERTAIEHELELISELGYEPYFLTVRDVVAFARARGILCQGRGSAANSRVCYCLGVTSVDPQRGAALLFERFISRERNEPPDIDIDFEHERREEVLQYVYGKYGRERAALAATVIMYRPRSALRDLGKVFGLTPDECARLAKVMQWWDGSAALAERVREAGFDVRSAWLKRLLPLAAELTAFPGFPRHLSQHVGGFVIARDLLEELVPIENAAMEDRTVVQWDKDDLNDLGLLKVDLLGLGMLSALQRAFALVNAYRGTRYTLGSLPPEDPKVYDMVCRADTVGVFQIESRAQMAMLPRLKPRCYYDLVIEVAIVRPGPIQGDMVHPYLKRRAGREAVDYPSDEVRAVLQRTLGVPIFQEQVMQIAIAAAGFTPGEADALRRAMGAWKRSGGLDPFRDRLLQGMHDRGYPREFAERIYQQMLGFGEYGFPECVVGETRVVDANCGRWLTIDEIVSGGARLRATLACDAELRLQHRRVVAIKSSGVKPVWRLKTALGHTITATAEHPFLTLGGWRALGQLRAGDHLAAARSLPRLGRRRWPRHQILVLADLIAEGNLPAEVFELCDSHIAWLLARLWEGHGGLSLRGYAAYDTASERLGLEVQHLLLRLGIVARLYRRQRSYQGRVLQHSVVVVTGEGLRGFWRLIGRRFLDPQKRRRSKSLAASAAGRMSHDLIPAEVCEIIRTEKIRAGMTWTALRRAAGLSLREIHSCSAAKIGLRRLVVKRLAAALRSQQLARLAASDVYWDRIVEIEKLAPRQTYDLHIDRNHSFLANNLVVHNSHSASFALLVYDSAWLKCYEPAAFACALINSQPMGFYAPAQLVRDARAHGVEVRPVDACASEWNATLEPREDGEPALRLGMCLVKSLSAAGAERLVLARRARAFASVQDLAARAQLDRGDLEALAAAGAFARLSGNRHLAFWQVAAVEAPLPLSPAAAAEEAGEGRPLLAAPTEGQQISADYASFGLTLGRHPLALLRTRLAAAALLPAGQLAQVAHGTRVRTAGIVLMRQRPGTAGGVTFLTLEDESGQVNVIVWERIGREQRRALLESRLLEVHGQLQHQEGVMHLIAHRLIDRTALLGALMTHSRDFH